jgi:hypothetical protein
VRTAGGQKGALQAVDMAGVEAAGRAVWVLAQVQPGMSSASSSAPTTPPAI